MSAQNNRSDRVQVLGLDVDALDGKAAVGRILTLAHGERGACVVSANLHAARLASDSPGFRTLLAEADVVLADGIPIVWFGRPRIPERVSGSEIVAPVCHAAAEAGLKVFFLGPSPAILDSAISVLQTRYPTLRVVGRHAPPDAFLTKETAVAQMIDDVKAASPDLVFVGLGMPQQEFFARRALGEIGRGVFLCVGSALDTLAGAKRRAPAALRSRGLEWLFRMAQEPMRLGPRYLRDALALPRLLASGGARRRKYDGGL